MKIGILSRNPKLYSTSRLLEEALASGHDCRVIDTPALHGHQLGQTLGLVSGSGIRAPRRHHSAHWCLHHNYGTAVIRQFEMMDTYSLVGSIPLGRSRSKLRALQLLSRKGLGMPATGLPTIFPIRQSSNLSAALRSWSNCWKEHRGVVSFLPRLRKQLNQ